MLVEAFLGGLVVHRTYAEDAVDACPVGLLQLAHNGGSVIAAATHEKGDAACYALDEGLAQPALLVGGETGGLSGGAHDAEEVGAAFDLEFYQTDEGLFVDAAIGFKRGDEGDAQAAKFILCHEVNSCLILFEEVDEGGDAFKGCLAGLLDIDGEADAHADGTA